MLKQPQQPLKAVKGYTIYPEMLGGGSFANVYKCQKDGNWYAVKIFHHHQNPEYRDYSKKALEQEISIMESLRGLSENILYLFDHTEEDNSNYLFLELCDETLENQLKNGPIPQSQAVQYLFQIVNGYRHLYHKKILHRDIKPENILIKGNVVKLADFGIAKEVKFQTNTVIGTPIYESPQLLRREKYTYKTDIWSITLTFYKMLYGCLPYNSSQPQSTKIILDEINKSNFMKDIQFSEPIRSFIQQGLQIQEADRIDFQALLKHPIFCNKFFIAKLTEDLRLSAQLKMFNIHAALESQKTQQKQFLKLEELEALLKLINKLIDRRDIKTMFNAYKVPNSDKIEREVIIKMLTNPPNGKQKVKTN